MPSFLRAQADGVLLAVKLQPRASRNEMGEPLGNELKIKVTVPPVDAAANEALLRLLAERLECPRGAVQLMRGSTSRHKTILIRDLPLEMILARLSSPPQVGRCNSPAVFGVAPENLPSAGGRRSPLSLGLLPRWFGGFPPSQHLS